MRLAELLRRLSVWALRVLVLALVGVGSVYLLALAWPLLLPLILAVLLTAVLWPLVALLRMVLPRVVAALVCLLGVTVVALGALSTALPQLATQVGRLAFSVVSGLDRLQVWVTGPPLSLGDDALGGLVEDVLAQMQANAQAIAFYVLGGITTIGATLAGGLLTVLLVGVLAFFLLSDGDRILPWSRRWLDETSARRAAALAHQLWTGTQHYVVERTATAGAGAVLVGVALLLAGVPLWLPVAVLAFAAAWVPVVGAAAVGVVAVLVAAVTVDVGTGLAVATVLVLGQLLLGVLLAPRLPGRPTRLHPAVVLAAVVVGLSLSGLVGALLAVPLTTAVVTVLRFLRRSLDPVPRPGGPTISW